MEAADLFICGEDQDRAKDKESQPDRYVVIEAHGKRHKRAAKVEDAARNFMQHEVADPLGLLEMVHCFAGGEACAVYPRTKEMGKSAPRDAPVEKDAKLDNEPLLPKIERGFERDRDQRKHGEHGKFQPNPSGDDIVDRPLHADRKDEAYSIGRARYQKHR